MTTREHIHELVDALPDSELEPIVEIMAARSTPEGTPPAGAQASESAGAQDARRAREFLISAADGNSGLDLDGLRSVRDRAWR